MTIATLLNGHLYIGILKFLCVFRTGIHISHRHPIKTYLVWKLYIPFPGKKTNRKQAICKKKKNTHLTFKSNVVSDRR